MATTANRTQAPAGTQIDASSGLISWTPTSAQVGYDTLAVQATNYAGQTSQTYSVAVIGARVPRRNVDPHIGLPRSADRRQRENCSTSRRV